MKIMPLIFFFLAIQMSLLLFVDSNLTEDGKSQAINDSIGYEWNPFGGYNSYSASDIDINYSDVQGNEQKARSQHFWDIFFNPQKGNVNLMLGYIIGFAAMIGALAFFPFINRSDLSMLSGPFLFILLAPTPILVRLYSFINDQVSGIACPSVDITTVNYICFTGIFFAVIVVGSLFLAWVLACWEHWVGRPVS